MTIGVWKVVRKLEAAIEKLFYKNSRATSKKKQLISDLVMLVMVGYDKFKITDLKKAQNVIKATWELFVIFVTAYQIKFLI